MSTSSSSYSSSMDCLPVFKGDKGKSVAIIETPASIRPICRHIFGRPNVSKFRVGHDVAPNVVTPPYDAAVLGSFVRSLGYDVAVVDANALPLSLAEVCAWIRRSAPDFVVIHAADNTLEEDMALAAFVEGLGIPCIYWDEILAPYRVAFVKQTYRFLRRILGEEPESHVAEFLAEASPPEELRCLTGGPGMDLNALPVVDFSLLPMSRYSKWGTRFWATVVMRGCTWGKCIYCLQARESRQKSCRIRSMANIRMELDPAIRAWGVKHVLFFSYEVNPTLRFFEELVALMSTYPGVTWECYLRADAFSEATVRGAAAAGCTDFFVGVENVDPRILASTQKNISRENLQSLFSLARRYGIRTTAMVMIGSPDETPESLRETVRFVRKLKPWSVVPAFLRVFPGTPVEEMVGKQHARDYLDSVLGHPGSETGTSPSFVAERVAESELVDCYNQLRNIGKGGLAWKWRFVWGFLREGRVVEEILVRLLRRVGRV